MVEAQVVYRERMMLRSAGRLLHRGMARAFGRWEGCAQATREMRRKAGMAMTWWTSMAKVIYRWRRTELRVPFDVWHQLFVDAHNKKTREHEWLGYQTLKQRNQSYRTSAQQACVVDSVSNSIDNVVSEIDQLKNDMSNLKTGARSRWSRRRGRIASA